MLSPFKLTGVRRYTAQELREDFVLLETSSRKWVPTTWAKLQGLQGLGSKGSRVFHIALGAGQVVEIYDTQFVLKCLDVLDFLRAVRPCLLSPPLFIVQTGLTTR